jgi:RimJ/RimL family protein N-acetyltransferase
MDLSFARRAPEIIQTKRLTLRRPCVDDAEAIFRNYASDPEVTRYLSWRTHRQLSDTRTYLIWSDHEWGRWPSGPFLVFSREPEDRLIGGTGLAFESAEEADWHLKVQKRRTQAMFWRAMRGDAAMPRSACRP